jgi:hypothetical protein
VGIEHREQPTRSRHYDHAVVVGIEGRVARSGLVAVVLQARHGGRPIHGSKGWLRGGNESAEQRHDDRNTSQSCTHRKTAAHQHHTPRSGSVENGTGRNCQM